MNLATNVERLRVVRSKKKTRAWSPWTEVFTDRIHRLSMHVSACRTAWDIYPTLPCRTRTNLFRFKHAPNSLGHSDSNRYIYIDFGEFHKLFPNIFVFLSPSLESGNAMVLYGVHIILCVVCMKPSSVKNCYFRSKRG